MTGVPISRVGSFHKVAKAAGAPKFTEMLIPPRSAIGLIVLVSLGRGAEVISLATGGFTDIVTSVVARRGR